MRSPRTDCPRAAQPPRLAIPGKAATALSMYLGEPPERRDVPAGGLVHVAPGTPVQTVNHGSDDLLVYAYGTPPESENAELLASAV